MSIHELRFGEPYPGQRYPLLEHYVLHTEEKALQQEPNLENSFLFNPFLAALGIGGFFRAPPFAGAFHWSTSILDQSGSHGLLLRKFHATTCISVQCHTSL